MQEAKDIGIKDVILKSKKHTRKVNRKLILKAYQ